MNPKTPLHSPGLDTRDRRALTIGILVISSLILGTKGIPAWKSWRETARTSAREMILEADRTRRVLGDLPGSLDTLEARTARLMAFGPALLVAQTEAEAGSALTSAIEELARLSSIEFEALRTTVDTAQGVAPRVSARGQGTGDIAGLSSFLRRIEEGPTAMAVRELRIRTQDASAPPTEMEVISFEISVDGLALLRPLEGQGADDPS